MGWTDTRAHPTECINRRRSQWQLFDSWHLRACRENTRAICRERRRNSKLVVRPSRNLPDPSQSNVPLNLRSVIIPVSKRALKVYSVFFRKPVYETPPGEILWPELFHTFIHGFCSRKTIWLCDEGTSYPTSPCLCYGKGVSISILEDSFF